MPVVAPFDFCFIRNYSQYRAYWDVKPAVLDLRAHLGAEAWRRLPPAVRRRFGSEAGRARRLYPGRMQVRASLAGRLFAQACRLIGTPLAPHVGQDVPVSVAVWKDGAGAMVWERTYAFTGRPPVTVSSRKQTSREGDLQEVVRGGLGMTLAVSVEDRALVFRSRSYFLSLWGWRLAVPHLLTPGAAEVIHADQGGGVFRFTLSFHHPILGETLFQTGLFHDPEPEFRP